MIWYGAKCPFTNWLSLARAHLKTSSSDRAKLVRLNAWLASTVRDGQSDGMKTWCCRAHTFLTLQAPQTEQHCDLM